MKILFLAFLLMFLNYSAHASGGWVAQCDTPEGRGIAYDAMSSLDGKKVPKNNFEPIQDGYTSVFPVFIYDGGNSNIISVIWDNTAPEGIPSELIGKTEVKKATILNKTPDGIVAYEKYPASAWLTTFFPDKGFVLSTRHQMITLQQLGYYASGTTFYMTCKFHPK